SLRNIVFLISRDATGANVPAPSLLALIRRGRSAVHAFAIRSPPFGHGLHAMCAARCRLGVLEDAFVPPDLSRARVADAWRLRGVRQLPAEGRAQLLSESGTAGRGTRCGRSRLHDQRL